MWKLVICIADRIIERHYKYEPDLRIDLEDLTLLVLDGEEETDVCVTYNPAKGDYFTLTKEKE